MHEIFTNVFTIFNHFSFEMDFFLLTKIKHINKTSAFYEHLKNRYKCNLPVKAVYWLISRYTYNLLLSIEPT